MVGNSSLGITSGLPVPLEELMKSLLNAEVERHRRELLIHCYRMLGSFLDSEDAVEGALLRA